MPAISEGFMQGLGPAARHVAWDASSQHPHNNNINPGTIMMPSRLFAADQHPRMGEYVVAMSKSIGIVVSLPFPHLNKDRWVSKSELRLRMPSLPQEMNAAVVA